MYKKNIKNIGAGGGILPVELRRGSSGTFGPDFKNGISGGGGLETGSSKLNLGISGGSLPEMINKFISNILRMKITIFALGLIATSCFGSHALANESSYGSTLPEVIFGGDGQGGFFSKGGGGGGAIPEVTLIKGGGTGGTLILETHDGGGGSETGCFNSQVIDETDGLEEMIFLNDVLTEQENLNLQNDSMGLCN